MLWVVINNVFNEVINVTGSNYFIIAFEELLSGLRCASRYFVVVGGDEK